MNFSTQNGAKMLKKTLCNKRFDKKITRIIELIASEFVAEES